MTTEPWATEAAAIARTDVPVTRAAVVAAFRAIGVQPSSLLIVHSSLSRLGWVVGGAHTVVDALVEVVGPAATVVMPSMSANLSEPSRWEAPPVPESWWQTIRDEMPAYDAALTPLVAMGAVAECFRHFPGTIRSEHPAVSLMANGPLARQVLCPHDMTVAFGEGSPLSRLHELDARILLIGVGHSNNTSLHLAESRTRWAREHIVTFGVPVMVDGERRWLTYDDVDYDSHDFEAAGAAFAAATGGEVRVPLGAGELISCNVRAIVDFAAEWLDYSRGTRV